jgi:prepilin-type N-terminal cleavage/methylation domain-containing protein
MRPAFARRGARGFTLLEMMLTLTIFLLLAGAVYGILTGVLEGSNTLLDNQSHRDEIAALNSYLNDQICTLPAQGTLFSYLRGQGEGLNQSGIIFGTANGATALDGTLQPNGLYTLRVTTFLTSGQPGEPQDARAYLQTAVTGNDPSLSWRTLMKDIKTLDWKFQDANGSDWVEQWVTNGNPNLVEFSLQGAGDLTPVTMDFWIPAIQTITLRVQAAPKTGP